MIQMTVNSDENTVTIKLLEDSLSDVQKELLAGMNPDFVKGALVVKESMTIPLDLAVCLARDLERLGS